MQLKMDTDYALRILFCVSGEDDTRKSETGWSTRELSFLTGIPLPIVYRTCERLKKNGFLVSASAAGSERHYAFAAGAENRTLLEVIECVEETAQLFAVFDPSSSMYTWCQPQLRKVQSDVTGALSRTRLSDFLDVPGR